MSFIETVEFVMMWIWIFDFFLNTGFSLIHCEHSLKFYSNLCLDYFLCFNMCVVFTEVRDINNVKYLILFINQTNMYTHISIYLFSLDKTLKYCQQYTTWFLNVQLFVKWFKCKLIKIVSCSNWKKSAINLYKKAYVAKVKWI